jgi:hypothetical protein
VPDRARLVVETALQFLPPCGHYTFPLAFLEATSAIGSGTPPALIHGCYAAERRRKERMLDYAFCLDAWLAGAGPEEAAAELVLRGRDIADWPKVCADVWRVLGPRDEAKELRVERLVHRERWWVKTHVWDDDSRDVFCRDRYMGDIRGSGDSYGNPDFKDPYFTERASPRVKELEKCAAALAGGSEFPWGGSEDTWLCSPKAFRFLERALWSIGNGGRPPGAGEAPGFLQCEDTCPSHDEAAEWWRDFLAALDGWWRGEPAGGRRSGSPEGSACPDGRGAVAEDVNARLGEATPVKEWLVRLYAHRLRVLASVGGEIRRLVAPTTGGWRGTAPLPWTPRPTGEADGE